MQFQIPEKKVLSTNIFESYCSKKFGISAFLLKMQKKLYISFSKTIIGNTNVNIKKDIAIISIFENLAPEV